MPQFRMFCLNWLLAGSVVLAAGAPAVFAQDEPKAKDAPKAKEEAKQESPPKEEAPKTDAKTAWPPKDAEKQVLGEENNKQSLVLYTPKTWKKEEPASRLRLGQFSIPAAEGDKQPVELAIFNFGAGGGGGVQANVDRWIGQFQAQGRKVKITRGEGHQGLYVLVDVEGTYNMPDGPPILQKTKPLPDARMLAVILGIPAEKKEGEEAKGVAIYFLKMAGPAKTVSENEDAFRTAFGAASKDKEQPLPLKEDSPQ